MCARVTWRALSLVLCLAAFVPASWASAAPVEILVQLIPGTTDWALRVNVNNSDRLGSVALEVSDTLTSFTINPTVPNISPFFDLSSFVAIGNGHNALVLNNISYGAAFVTGPELGVELGVFHSAVSDPALILVLPAEAHIGDTLVDPFGNPYPTSEFTIAVTPEPSTSLLLALAVAGFAIGNRRARLTRL